MPGGAIVPSAALTNVTVAPTHRRQGLLRRMLEPDLAAAKERGEPVGMLIAAEFPIYGRFGYGSAADQADFEVDARTARFRAPGPARSSWSTLAALRKAGPALYERVRARPARVHRPRTSAGGTAPADHASPGDKPYKGYLAVGRNAAGEPDGYVRYQHRRQVGRPPAGPHARGRRAGGGHARRVRPAVALLLRGRLGGDGEGRRPRPREALPWLVADARARGAAVADFLWVRILDVASLLAARALPHRGRVVLEVVDAQGLATGRFAVEGGPDGASCTPTTEAAGLTLGVGARRRLPRRRVAADAGDGRAQVDVHDPAALATADAMFRGAVDPWCSTWF